MGTGFDAGSVFVKLGFDVDPSGADRYERREADIRRRAAKPIKQDVALDVDERSFREAASKSDAAAKSSLKVRDAQLKLETANERAAAAEAKHGRESLEYRRSALAVERATLGLADSQGALDRQVEKVARTMATDAQRSADGYTRSIKRVDHAMDQVDGSARRMGRGAAAADRDVGRLRLGMGRVGGLSASVATGIAGTGVAAIGAAAGVSSLVGAYEESYKVSQQTESAIRSTGGAAKVTAEEVGELSGALSRMSGMDDEAIQTGANLLLTFKNVRNEAGKNNDIYNQTTRAAVDMAAALGTDVKSAAMQLGKALNEPEKGLAKLGRSGVQFSEDQKKQVEALVESGDTMEAQKIILAELDSQFGGSAAAQATNTDRMKVAVGNLAETLGEKLFPVVTRGTGLVSMWINNLLEGEGAAGSFAAGAGGAAKKVGEFAEDIGSAIGDVIAWFRSVYEENADTIGDIGDTFSQLAAIGRRAFGDIKRALKEVFGEGSGTGRDVRKIIGALLDLASAGLRLWKDVAKRALPGIVDAFKGVATVIRGVVRVISGILSGDFAKVWDGLKDIVGGALSSLGGAIRAGTAPVRELASKMGSAVSSPLTSIWGGIKRAWRTGLDVILGGVSTAAGAIATMLDAASKLPVVGGKFKGLADDVRKGQKAIDEYRESLRKANKEQERTEGIKKMRGEVSDLKDRLKGLKRGTDDYRETSEKLRKKQRELNRAIGDGESAGRRGARGVEQIGTAGGNAATAVYNAADNISSNLIAVSKGLGIKAPSFAVKVPRGQGVSGGGRSSKGDAAFVKGHAVGGIPNPGSGSSDDHMLVDRAGRPVAMMSGTEGILNTPQMQIVDQALQVAQMVGVSQYGGLGDLWSSGLRHYAGGGSLAGVPRYAGGGIVPVPGFPGESAAASVIPQILSVARQFALTLTDAFGPGHKSPGHTVTGTAADFAGPDPNMDRAVKHLVGRGYLVGYDGRYGSADWPGHGPAAGQGGGNAHLHVEFAGKGRGVGGGARGGLSVGKIETPTITGPNGALLSIVRGAASNMAKGANTWLDRKADALSVPAAGGGGASGGKTSAGGTYDKARLKALWKRHNNNGDPNLMAAIALAESSGNPRSIGIPTSGGRAHGLWQIMWPAHAGTFPGRNPLNVDDNAIMAGSILRSQGLGAWEAYTRGMHVKFLARGGQAKKSKKLPAARLSKARAMLSQLWEGARGYYPGAGSKEPRSKYGATSGFEGSSVGMLANAGGGRSGRYVNWPAWTLEDLTGTNRARASAMAETAIHEWAHYHQSPKVFAKTPGITYMEGGAQAFTRRVAPAVFSSAGLPFKLQSKSADLYYPYARHVERQMGERWVMRDQFNQPAALKYKYPRGVKGPYGYNGGGLLADLPRFSKGGRQKPSFKESALADAGLDSSTFRAMRGKQNDRVGSFDRVSELLEVDAKRYGLQERRNDLTDEVLIDEETGLVNTGDVKRRAGELKKLADIKRRMTQRLRKARTIAKRVQKTYSTIIARLKKALKAATSGKKGKSSKARKAAAKSYREQIADYLGRRKEWRGKEGDLGFDIEDADIDLSALLGERKEVLGTKAEAREGEAAESDVDASSDVDDSSPDAGGDAGTATPSPEAEPVPTPPSPEDIAKGVAERFAAFSASRADLFGNFGANFRSTLPQSFGGQMDDSGARYFGGGASGTEAGAVATAGGQSSPTEGAQIQLNVYHQGPQPIDPHAEAATMLHELQVRV